jgi:catechol 2,3-dioxygenase-like lactoylglutathione lyase family enzyme
MPDPAMPDASHVRFHPASPILRVQSLPSSIDYYVSLLGFGLDWLEPGVIASVSRGPASLMLCEGDQGHPGTWLWIGVGNVEPLYEEFTARGAVIRHPPTNYPWAYEMQVSDPDGHVIRFGSETKDGEPFGEWVDMYGKRWGGEGPGQR